MSYLTTQCGKQVYFESYGDGDVAMVLVHGWGMSVRTWDHVLPSPARCGIARRADGPPRLWRIVEGFC